MGKLKKSLKTWTMMGSGIALVMILLSSCGKAPENTGEDTTGTPVKELVLSGEQLELADISTGGLLLRELSGELKCNGQVEVPARHIISLTLPVDAFVRKIAVHSGSRVRKGDLLAEMEHPDILELQREYLVTGNELLLLKKDLDRQEILAKEEAVSGKQLLAVRTAYENTRINHSALEKKLRLIGINPENLDAGNLSPTLTLHSRTDGFVRMNFANTGELIPAGDPVMELEEAGKLQLYLQVYASDLHLLKTGQEVAFRTASDTREYRARIQTIGNTILEETRSAAVTAELINPDKGVYSGMYVKAVIFLSRRTVNAIPEGGIAREGGETYVFSYDKETFRRIPVGTGMVYGGFVEILDPAPLKGLQLVHSGAYYLNAMLSGE